MKPLLSGITGEPLTTEASPLAAATVPTFGLTKVAEYQQSDGTMLVDLRCPRTGFRVLHHNLRTPYVSFCLDFPVAPDSDSGAPHCAEHMAFRGREPREPVSVYQRWSSAPDVNACTLSDGVAFSATAYSSADLMVFLNLYLDGIFFPEYPVPGFREEIFRVTSSPRENASRGGDGESTEKRLTGIVLHEMLDAYASPRWVVAQGMQRSLFPESFLAFDAAGVPAAIPSLTVTGLKEFARKYFVPSNCTLVVVGDLPESRLAGMLDLYLSRFPRRNVPSIQLDLSAQREFAKPVEVNLPNLGERGVVQAVGFAARPTTDAHREWLQRFCVELFSSDDPTLRALVAEECGFRGNIFGSESLLSTPASVLLLAGERHASRDAGSLTDAGVRVLSRLAESPQLPQLIRRVSDSLELGFFDSPEALSQHSYSIAEAARRGLSVSLAADQELQKAKLEALVSDPTPLIHCLREDFAEWRHAGVVTGRQRRGLDRLWAVTELRLARRLMTAAKTPEDRTALFYRAAGRPESKSALARIARMVPTEPEEARLVLPKVTTHAPGQLSVDLVSKRHAAIYSGAISLRNMPVESLPWAGFVQRNLAQLIPRSSGVSQPLVNAINIVPGQMGFPVPWFCMTRGVVLGENPLRLPLQVPADEELRNLLEQDWDAFQMTLEDQPRDYVMDEAWARVQPAGRVSRWIERVVSDPRKLSSNELRRVAAHLEYVIEYLRREPISSSVWSRRELAPLLCDSVQEETPPAPFWPVREPLSRSEDDHRRDAVTSSVAVCFETDWSPAVGALVARYLEAELLWPTFRRGAGSYSVGAQWDPEWKLLTVQASQMRDPSRFMELLGRIAPEVKALQQREVFTRYQSLVRESLVAPRAAEDWCHAVLEWELAGLPLSAQLEELRQLTPKDFVGVGTSLRAWVDRATPTILGPQ